MSLFENAIHAIQAGAEDFALGAGNDGRLKSAIRNVHAGVLLLFKTHLQQLSPPDSDEVLLKQNIKPIQLTDGSIRFVGDGKKTADVQTIKSRFTALNIDLDWNRFEAATKIRNEVEHYFTRQPEQLVREAVADCFSIAHQFCTEVLDKDLRSHLSEEAWEQLIEIERIIESEKHRCLESRAHFRPNSDFAREGLRQFVCTDCFSQLIHFREVGSAECRCCGKTWSQSEIVVDVVKSAGAGDHYDAIKDGGSLTVIDCPECNEFTYIVCEAYCVNCECSCPSECDLCGMGIPAEEIDGGSYCSGCRHLLSKDD